MICLLAFLNVSQAFNYFMHFNHIFLRTNIRQHCPKGIRNFLPFPHITVKLLCEEFLEFRKLVAHNMFYGQSGKAASLDHESCSCLQFVSCLLMQNVLSSLWSSPIIIPHPPRPSPNSRAEQRELWSPTEKPQLPSSVPLTLHLISAFFGSDLCLCLTAI